MPDIATNPANPQTQEVVNTDPLLGDIPDDPIFQAAEPYKGIDRKAVLASLPEDAKKDVQNIRLGAQKAVSEALESRKAADAEKAAAAKEREEAAAVKSAWQAKLAEFSQPGGGDPLTMFKAEPRAAKFYGVDEGDPFEGEPEVEVDDIDVNDDVLSDPAKLKGVLRDALAKAVKTAVKKARADILDAHRTTAKPAIELANQQRAARQQEAAKTAEQAWREAHPLASADDGWGEFYEFSKREFGVTDERWPYSNAQAWEAGYKLFSAHKGAPAPAATQDAAKAPAATPAAVPAPAPKNPLNELVSALRRNAQDAQGGGGVGTEDGEMVIPASIRDDHAARTRWIESNPKAKQAFESGDQELIARLMGRGPVKRK